jgi:hypothetical protein
VSVIYPMQWKQGLSSESIGPPYSESANISFQVFNLQYSSGRLLVATSSDGKEKDLLQPSAKSSVGEKVTFGISTKEADASCMYCTTLYMITLINLCMLCDGYDVYCCIRLVCNYMKETFHKQSWSIQSLCCRLSTLDYISYRLFTNIHIHIDIYCCYDYTIHDLHSP